MSKGKRCPHKLRADGQVKGLALVSFFGWVDNNRRPAWASAGRTRSLRWIAGCRRTKRIMRAKRRAGRQAGGDGLPEGYEPSCYRCNMGDPHEVHCTADEYFGGA